MTPVYVRWIVEGAGPYNLTVRSIKGGIALRTLATPVTSVADAPANSRDWIGSRYFTDGAGAWRLTAQNQTRFSRFDRDRETLVSLFSRAVRQRAPRLAIYVSGRAPAAGSAAAKVPPRQSEPGVVSPRIAPQ